MLVAGPEEAKNLAGESPPPDSESVENFESEKNLVRLSRKKLAAMRVCNPDCSPLGIKG
jgi:hypothetical protein